MATIDQVKAINNAKQSNECAMHSVWFWHLADALQNKLSPKKSIENVIAATMVSVAEL